MPNQIKIKSSPPLSTEFSPTDLVVDIKNGHLYFKSNVRIHKLTDAKDLSEVTTELEAQIQVLASLSASHAELTFSTLTHDTPTGSGFYLDYNHLGYYSGSEWQTFMSSSGNFYLGGELGGLVWNHDANTLSIAGHVQAYSGTVGGFTIGLTSLSSSNFIINTFDSKILLGNPSSSNVFIVDADTGMHLGDPDFASAPFSVTKGGALKSTSGEIGGFTIGAGGLTAQNFELLTAEKSLTLGAGNSIFIADGDVGIHLGNATFANAPFSVTLGGSLTATLGQIAGWNIDNEKISNTGVHLSSSYGLKVFDGVDDGLDFVEMKYKASDNWGLVGKESGQEIFQLGNQNQIAGWSFDQNKIISNYGVNSPTNPGIVIKSEGTIETDPFISGLTANATGWQIRADGRAEFENAVIRGTLSTAVFEKDTISVVGGQVMIANAAKVDNVNPRFTDYPYLKSAIGENINWSGEELPITGSSIRSGSLFPYSLNVEAPFATSQNLWLKFSNKNAAVGEAKFSIGTGSYAPGTKFRLSLYSSGSVKSGTYRQPGFQLHTNNSPSYTPQFSLNGGSLASAFQTLSDGLNIIEFSSSADWNASSTHNAGPTLHFKQNYAMNAIGDSFYLRDIHCIALSQSLTVDNAGGFVKGEYLVAKSTDQGPDGREGFVREYMQVISSSLGVSDTPASGTFDFSNVTINTATNIFVTASKKYTFTGVTSPTTDQVADNQYYFVLGTNPNSVQGKQKSLINLKDKIVEEVLDIFAMTTGSQPGVLNQIYFQGHGVGIDGNAYGVQYGSTQVTLQGGIDRTKPTLTVERNMDARVSGNERGYWIDRIKDGQSMASQGAAGTGYILLNAQPTDTSTPYIDIVERQDTTVGSQQHTGNDKNSVFGEVTTLARIGDLSGITDYNFSDGVNGYGIYTSNGYFKGKVEVSSLPITPPSENLIFHLPLDGKVLTGSQGSGSFPDLSGNNYHNNNNYISSSITWAGTSVTVNSASAKIGGSAVFTATAGDANRLIYKNIPLRDNHTFAAWVKIDSSDTSQMLFAIDANSSYTNPFTGGSLNPGTGGAGADGQLDLWFISNTILWNTGDSWSNPFRTQGNTANVSWYQYNNTWTHFAVVNNSSTLSASLYINGKLEGYAAYRNPTTNAGVGDLTVGGYVYSSNTNSNYNFKGEIDDFRIYTGSLSSNQVESIYLSPDSGTGRTIISGDSISSGHLRSNNWGPSFGSEYNLNEGTFKLGGSDLPKLSWNGSQLVVRGQIHIEAGSTLPSGATITSLESCVISSDTQIFAFDDSNDTTPTPSTATITVQQANQLNNIVDSDITVTNGTKSNFSYAAGANTGTGTATFTVTPSGTYPVTVTVANDGITDTITLHKVQGGTNAYTIILSNEAHTLAADATGTVSSFANSGTTISVYKGLTELNSISAGTPTSGQFKVTATGTGITPNASPDTTGNPTVFGNASTMTANNASISFAVNIENVTTITKVQSFAKSIEGVAGGDGSNGTSARAVSLSSGTTFAFAYDSAGANPTPANTKITASALNYSGTPHYEFLKNGTQVQQGTTQYYTYTPPALFSNMPESIQVRLREDSNASTILASDGISILGLQSASNALQVDLSNASHTIPTPYAGSPVYTYSGTTIKVYEGSNPLTYDGLGTANGTWTLTLQSAVNISVGTFTDSGTYVTVGDASNMNANQNVASLTYAITGKRADGTAFTIEKQQSFNRSNDGVPGSDGSNGIDARAVSLSSSILAFAYDSAGANPTPATAQVGASAVNTVGTVYYEFIVDGVSQANTTTNSVTYTPQPLFSNMPDTIQVHIREGSATSAILATDTLGIIGLRNATDGINALNVVLSNDSHVLPANSAGTVSSFANSGTTIYVYKGITQLNSIASGTPTSGEFLVTATGTGITPGYMYHNPTVFGNASNMTANNASISLAVNIENVTTITKVQSFSKSTAGSNGSTGPAGPNFSFLTGSLSTLDVSTAIPAGLLMTDDVFGYHKQIPTNATSDAAKLEKFTSLLDKDGNFYLGSGSGAGHLTWENSNSVLTVSGTINATAGNIGGFGIKTGVLSGPEFFISGSSTGNQFFISSSKFNVKANGDITASALRLQDANGYVNYNSQAGTFDGMTNLRFIGEINGPNVGDYNGNYNMSVHTKKTPYIRHRAGADYGANKFFKIGGRLNNSTNDNFDEWIWSNPFFTFPQEEWIIISYTAGLSTDGAYNNSYYSNFWNFHPTIKYVANTTLDGATMWTAYIDNPAKYQPELMYDGQLTFPAASANIGSGQENSPAIHRPGLYAIKLTGYTANASGFFNWPLTTYNIKNATMRLALYVTFLNQPKNENGVAIASYLDQPYLIMDDVRIFACTNKAKENLFSLGSSYAQACFTQTTYPLSTYGMTFPNPPQGTDLWWPNGAF